MTIWVWTFGKKNEMKPPFLPCTFITTCHACRAVHPVVSRDQIDQAANHRHTVACLHWASHMLMMPFLLLFRNRRLFNHLWATRSVERWWRRQGRADHCLPGKRMKWSRIILIFVVKSGARSNKLKRFVFWIDGMDGISYYFICPLALSHISNRYLIDDMLGMIREHIWLII